MLFGAWLVFVVALGQPNYLGSDFVRASALQAAYGLLFAVYGLTLLRKRRLPSSLAIDGAALLALITLVVAALAAVDRRISLESASLSIAPIVVLYALNDTKSLTPARLMRVLVVTGAFMAVFGLMLEAKRYLDWLDLASSVDGGFKTSHLLPPQLPRSGGLMHENDQALILDLVLPFALYLAVWPRAPFDRVVGIAGSLLIAAGSFVTFTRGGWLGLIAAAVVFAALYLLSTRRSMLDALSGLPWLRIGAGAGAAAVLGAIAVVVAWGSLSGFLLRDTVSLRMEVATKALEIFKDHPLTGVGPNGFGLFYDSYGGTSVVNNVHPHNAYLSVLVDSGIVGAALLSVAAVIAAAWLMKAFVAGSSSQRLVLSTCVASAVTVIVHGLVLSPQLFNPAMLLAIAVTVIALKSAPRVSMPWSIQAATPMRFAVVGAIPLLVAGWVYVERPNSTYDGSLIAYQEGRIADASQAASVAADADPTSAAYLVNAGTLRVELYRTLGQRAQLEEAAAYFRRAGEAEPRGAIARANLALTLMMLGDRDGAKDAAEEARMLSPNNAEIAAIAGTVFETKGDEMSAVDAYARVIEKEPRLAQSPFWAVSEERMKLRQRAAEASEVTPCIQGKTTVLFGTYPDELPALLDACSALEHAALADRSAMAFMLYATGDVTGLQDVVARLQADAPGSGGTLVASALLAAAQGDLQKLRHDLLWASAKSSLEAPLLLAATYGGDGVASVSPLLRLPSTAGPVPPQVLARVQRVEPQVAGFARPWTAREARNYFQIDLLRRAPAVIFVPGEWQQLMSPRPAADPLALR